MEDNQFDAIIIGGGLAGLAAAWTLADRGKEVLLLEKGDYCGAKNVTGGRLYVEPLKGFFDDLWDKAPLERSIAREEICLVAPTKSLTVSYTDDSLSSIPGQSYSVCRAKLDRFFAKQVERKGAVIATKTRVDSLVIENGAVIGITAGGDTLYAKTVICCDGVLSLFPQQAGLRGPLKPKHSAIGVKEIIELDPQLINERFGVSDEQGAARLFMGDITCGRFGGGFLYTNKESISLGLVLGIEAFSQEGIEISVPEALDRFKERPEVLPLIAGGEPVEYSAHVVLEGSYNQLSKLYGNGILVAGDAAGFSLNAGITVRGMEYAVMSGYFAALAVEKALEKNDFGAESLSVYETLLADSFVLKDSKEHQNVAASLDHDRFFSFYPSFVCDLMHDLYKVNGPKKRIYPTLRKHLTAGVMKDILFKDFGKVKKL
ncbi:MAG: FAD-dependent oxidoreductase [Coriobacteriia bacterium]|nr:FAD-dependent oxidoreductase [Coriobacteriia bacterium]MCL2749823.1 FAD-dependent oxidoreductase [Coriobacteriia bacterium]